MEFVNRILDAYFISLNVRYILGSLYHPQSQGAIEAFKKIVQKSHIAAYNNAKQ